MTVSRKRHVLAGHSDLRTIRSPGSCQLHHQISTWRCESSKKCKRNSRQGRLKKKNSRLDANVCPSVTNICESVTVSVLTHLIPIVTQPRIMTLHGLLFCLVTRVSLYPGSSEARCVAIKYQPSQPQAEGTLHSAQYSLQENHGFTGGAHKRFPLHVSAR